MQNGATHETSSTDRHRWNQNHLPRCLEMGLGTRTPACSHRPRFTRPEPRRWALAYLKVIVSATPRKNGWQLAEHAGEGRPDGMQRLLNSAAWDADLVHDNLLAYTL